MHIKYRGGRFRVFPQMGAFTLHTFPFAVIFKADALQLELPDVEISKRSFFGYLGNAPSAACRFSFLHKCVLQCAILHSYPRPFNLSAWNLIRNFKRSIEKKKRKKPSGRWGRGEFLEIRKWHMSGTPPDVVSLRLCYKLCIQMSWRKKHVADWENMREMRRMISAWQHLEESPIWPAKMEEKLCLEGKPSDSSGK